MLRDDTTSVKVRIKSMSETMPRLAFYACGNTREPLDPPAVDRAVPARDYWSFLGKKSPLASLLSAVVEKGSCRQEISFGCYAEGNAPMPSAHENHCVIPPVVTTGPLSRSSAEHGCASRGGWQMNWRRRCVESSVSWVERQPLRRFWTR